MIEALTENPILLLFIVAGLGYGVGSISIRGNSLGVAAVLFVGLFIGSFSPDLRIPEIITFLGLSIFVYTVGLGSGPSFFSTFKRRGWQDLIFVFIMLTFSASIAAGLHYFLQFDASITAGLFVGQHDQYPGVGGLVGYDPQSGFGRKCEQTRRRKQRNWVFPFLPDGYFGPNVGRDFDAKTPQD